MDCIKGVLAAEQQQEMVKFEWNFRFRISMGVESFHGNTPAVMRFLEDGRLTIKADFMDPHHQYRHVIFSLSVTDMVLP